MLWRWQAAQFFELRWWRSYLAGQKPENYLAWKRRYWSDFLEKSEIYPTPGACVLDAGCGPAGIFTVLKKNVVWAVDPLLDYYDTNLEHFRKSDYPWVRFEAASMESLDKEDFFDVVFCLNAVNHVADWTAAMAALVRVLKPGGTLVLSVDVHRHGLLKTLFRLFPGDVLHPQQHDLNDYVSWLERSGMAPLRMFSLKKERIFEYWVLVCRKPEL
ncbi:MAG: class I SAM-dependent methyltransferase [Saprospiraceae bacterium]|nr:class I SAM-dependent methyltransferase [Saprospiraceae bacterium]